VDYPDTCRSPFFDDIRQVQVGCKAHSLNLVTCLPLSLRERAEMFTYLP
jgi:hypothetical protein